MSEPLIPPMSVVICTHNRAAYLGIAIDSALSQSLQDYEVLVVDNASTDGTYDVVGARQRDSRLRYLHEPRLGLSVARNAGAQAATGTVLAYLDDDAKASPGWLEALQRAFADPQVAVAGGPSGLIWPAEAAAPRWLSAELSGSLGAYDLGDSYRQITQPNQTPRGLNYALRKSFWQQVGGFDNQLGRVGKNLLSNEELHMTQLALQHQQRVVYVPGARVEHHVSPERLRRQWFLRRSWWQGISECYREQLSGQASQAALGRRGMSLVRGLVKAGKYWRDPAQRFDNLVYAYGQLGYLSSRARSWALGSPLATLNAKK